MNGRLPECFRNLFRRLFGLFYPFGVAEKFVGRGGAAQGVVFVELDEGFHAVTATECHVDAQVFFIRADGFQHRVHFAAVCFIVRVFDFDAFADAFGQFFAAYPRAFMHITFAFLAALGGYMGKFFKAVFVDDEVSAVRIVLGAEALRMRIDVGGLRGGNGQA